ncbi:Mid2-like cell wall stress sensor domain protein [Staphylococcus pettenkoferi]|uniref:Mid2-like cell wall stress sensor domain protein n=1 Tax=Staphylococcus pettenkoferi TaxID=170573 RepID=UPI00066C496A|nr:Mid2-like cell wall stress sensor domain protein [Staphylococcus pettenkoferi]MDK7113875.1 Mid2-like cell wall stress sensor domain protein [Staphylococcus pettenkoferi]MDK7282554.1 Mid2-like cell wall stress sensor domain protein [Staphylococcus pettenkoferi]
MFNFWVLFGITLLIAVYCGITFFSNMSQSVQNREDNKSKNKNNIYGIVFGIFIVLAIIELLVFIFVG